MLPDNLETADWCAPVRALYEYWCSIRPLNAPFPGRQHFDPLLIPQLMPLVWMLDVVRANEVIRFRYRLVGTRHVIAMTRDYTGWWLDEAHPNFLTHGAYSHYLAVAAGDVSFRRGRPGFHVHEDYYEMERILLPMARNGTTVDMVLAITVYFDHRGHPVG
jgi:hypothetical protein